MKRSDLKPGMRVYLREHPTDKPNGWREAIVVFPEGDEGAASKKYSFSKSTYVALAQRRYRDEVEQWVPVHSVLGKIRPVEEYDAAMVAFKATLVVEDAYKAEHDAEQSRIEVKLDIINQALGLGTLVYLGKDYGNPRGEHWRPPTGFNVYPPEDQRDHGFHPRSTDRGALEEWLDALAARLGVEVAS